LVAACGDGTLPATLNLDQIWVQQNGRVQLTDNPGDTASPSVTSQGSPAERCLDLLRQVAVLALEGQPRTAPSGQTSIRAPLPEHARQILDRLLGVHNPYTTPEQLQADLAATEEEPTEVDAGLRAGHLAVQAALLAPTILLALLAGFVIPPLLGADDGPRRYVDHDVYAPIIWPAIGAAVLWPILYIVWSFVMCGGITLGMMGLSLVDAEGRPASRFQCAWRALLVWAPIILLLVSTYWWPVWVTGEPSFAGFARAWAACWVLLGFIFGFYLWLGVSFPNQAVHDRFADTYLVPR
jgi:uncharacterized RDD family membrane protein YckC